MNDDKKRRILRRVDHTLLKPTATWDQVHFLCEEAIRYEAASVCIPPCFVERAAAVYGRDIPIGTVIGFPLGYSTTASKVFEAEEAVRGGAAELDVVINIGDVKCGAFGLIEEELAALRRAAEGRVFKVIIETCFLEAAEKTALCALVTASGADFIKTSTGFGSAGAALEDIALLRTHIGTGVRIKAAGGMRTAGEHEAFFDAGADRLGSSSAIRALYGTAD